MTLKVIGAGQGRTGTMSLKLALEALGLGPCYHMVEVFKRPDAAEQWLEAADGKPVSWEKIFEGYASTVDFPAAAFFEPLARHYRQAKIILTLRDPDKWFDSTQGTIFKDMDEIVANPASAWGRMIKRVIWDLFDGRIHDRAHATAVFRAHNARVMEVIPRERLLIYEISEGWEPLCRFLGLPVPAIPFPKANTTEDFVKTHTLRMEQERGTP